MSANLVTLLLQFINIRQKPCANNEDLIKKLTFNEAIIENIITIPSESRKVKRLPKLSVESL
jgi:hypothetical protein